MSLDASLDRRKQSQTTGTDNGNGLVSSGMQPYASNRLRLQPKEDHKSESYEDLTLEFTPILYSTLEKHLPPNILNGARDVKLQHMRDILLRYSPEGERNRVQRHREYRQKIISNYQSLNRELYTLHAASFFVPSFLKAISENTEESFRRIMSEPSPGIYTFEMFQPRFCEMLLSEITEKGKIVKIGNLKSGFEMVGKPLGIVRAQRGTREHPLDQKIKERVENFENWVHETKFRIMRPNTMNKYGAVLDDFGLDPMLDKLMIDFVRPMSKVFFSEVGGATLDSHHGFVVEYGMDRDVELGFHVDDAEVTLNVCLSKQFSGGELFFRGIRCDKHVNTETQPEEIFDYFHVPGCAVLHRGRHRHGARATTSGRRVNLLLWCRSSVFRELKKYQKDLYGWCGECQREKRERQRLSITSTKQELLRREGKSPS